MYSCPMKVKLSHGGAQAHDVPSLLLNKNAQTPLGQVVRLPCKAIFSGLIGLLNLRGG